MLLKKSIAEENSRKRDLAEKAGLVFIEPDTSKQQAALAAANAAFLHPEERARIIQEAQISAPTLRKYQERLTSPCMRDARPSDLVNSVGRPKTYTLEMDSEFIEWVENKKKHRCQKRR